MTEREHLEALAAYIRVIIAAWLDDEAQRAAVSVAHAPGAFNEHKYLVRVPRDGIRFVLGHQGCNVNALRTCLRAAARAGKVQSRVDVRVEAA